MSTVHIRIQLTETLDNPKKCLCERNSLGFHPLKSKEHLSELKKEGKHDKCISQFHEELFELT